MFGRTWKTSKRKYDVLIERDVKIPVRDGTILNADVIRPKSEDKFPAILGYFPYNLEMQSAPIHTDSFSSVVFKHPNQEKANASIEAGDSNFYARRGYVHVLVNIRGTGKSGGKYSFIGPQELQDGYDVVEWIAVQPWCDGQDGRVLPTYWDKDRYQQAITELLQDKDILAVRELVGVLKYPDSGSNPLLIDFLLNPLDNEFWEQRRVDYAGVKVPVYRRLLGTYRTSSAGRFSKLGTA